MIKKFLIGLIFVFATIVFFFPATVWSEESDDTMTIVADSDLLNEKTDDVLYITPNGTITEDTETYSGYCVILESFNGATPVDRTENASKINLNFTNNQLRMPEFYLPNLNVKFKMRSRYIVPGPRHVIIRRYHRGPRIHRIPPLRIHRHRPPRIHRPLRIHRPPRIHHPPRIHRPHHRPMPPKRPRPSKPRHR